MLEAKNTKIRGFTPSPERALSNQERKAFDARLVRGFTLIEILIVMGITIILGGVGASNYYNYQSVQVLEGTSNEFTGALRDARQRAVSQDESSAWGVYINAVADGNDYYELFYGDSHATGTVASRTTLPSGVKFAIPAQGQTLEINFAKSTGLPNGEYTVTVASVKNGSVAETITLNTTTGTVSVVSGVASAPTISSIIPSSGLNDDVVSITNLAGTGFQQSASVKLTKTGQSDIACSDVSFVSSIKLTCTCDITGAVVGDWNVVVTNADAQSITLSDGFEVTAYVPGAPTIGVATVGSAQSSVTFTPPASDGGSPITGYTVTSNPGAFTGTGASSPIVVSGLTNGTSYTFTVTATNAIGTGSASAASNSTTPATVPGAPTIGTATAGNGQASVTFTAPASNGGSAITGYTVTSNPGAFTGTGASSPIVVSGLTNGTAYTFTVTATNAIGTGSASAASNSTTPATVPGAPTIGTATTGNGQASVTFTAPASNGGSAITGYTATSNPGGFTGTGASSPIVVSSLTNGTSYTFTVTATNAIGTGSASAASNSTTPATVPGAPTIGTATTGNGQASVTFTAPASNGGSAITGYTATSNPGGFTGTGASSPIVVSGLTNGTSYTFTVTATNAVGTGSASAASNSVAPSCGIAVVDSRDSKTYSTVQIGDQCWFSQNINIGTMTAGTNTQGTDCPSASEIEKYCYSNTESNCTSYGGLYQWNQAMCGGTSTPAKGICPTGWRIPTDAELCVLEQYLDSSITCDSTDFRGTDGGGKLKESGTTHWTSPNTGATNSSGFTALPAGYRSTDGGSFAGLTSYTIIWSSVDSGSNAWSRHLRTATANVSRNAYEKAGGVSVRCLKDSAPIAPTIGTATAGNGQASVTFTAPASNGGSAITGYTVTSNPGAFTGTGASSPIVVSGLTNGTSYTFTVTATNAIGTGSASAASNSVTPLTIGTSYQGGVVAYILQAGDPGYNASVLHGLIAAPSDQIKYWCPVEFYAQAVGTSAIILGTGNTNTNAIVSFVGAGDYGAKVCQDLTLDGYSDWYMPSEDELGKLMTSASIIGLLPDNGSSQTGRYYSSSECYDGSGSQLYAARSYYLYPNFGAAQFCADKISSSATSIRCTRSF